MKKMLSRKFLVLVLITLCSWVAYYVTLSAAPDILGPTVFVAIMSTQALFGMAYIGGNVWQKFIETKGASATPPRKSLAEIRAGQ